MMTETRFPNHSRETAPEGAHTAFEQAEAAFGMVPNLTRKMATAPALAQAYLALSALFDQTSLSPVERQVVLLAASRFNGCHYCVGAHSWLAEQAGMPPETLQALRDDKPIADTRLDALRRFATAVVERRGWVDGAEMDEFLDAGYSPQTALEVVLGVGLKTLSNYTNHIAGTDLDTVFAAHAWTPAA